MNTPEIQARVERLTREHPPAKGMEWILNDANTGYEKITTILHYDGVWFRQVPAEAKEEAQRLADYKEWLQSRAHLEEGQEIGAGFDPDGPSQKEPGLDYERLFEVLQPHYTAYAADSNGDVFVFEARPTMEALVWLHGGSCDHISATFLLRNLPADWTQSLRAREPKPEPDVEPDDKTEFGAHVEVMTDFGWQAARFIGFRGCTDDMPKFGCVPDGELAIRFYARCRLRREGK